MTLKIYEVVSSSKRNVSKSYALWAGTYKNRIDQPEKQNGHNFPLKNLVVSFGNCIFDNSNWDKIKESMIKNPYLE